MSDSERDMRCAGIETADPRETCGARAPTPARPPGRARPGVGPGTWKGPGGGRPRGAGILSLVWIFLIHVLTTVRYTAWKGLATFFRGALGSNLVTKV